MHARDMTKCPQKDEGLIRIFNAHKALLTLEREIERTSVKLAICKTKILPLHPAQQRLARQVINIPLCFGEGDVDGLICNVILLLLYVRILYTYSVA